MLVGANIPCNVRTLQVYLDPLGTTLGEVYANKDNGPGERQGLDRIDRGLLLQGLDGEIDGALLDILHAARSAGGVPAREFAGRGVPAGRAPHMDWKA